MPTSLSVLKRLPASLPVRHPLPRLLQPVTSPASRFWKERITTRTLLSQSHGQKRLMSSSVTSPLRFSPDDIPPGWHAEVDNNLACVSENLPGEDFGIPLPLTPLLYCDNHQDVLVECGAGNYYIWNEIADDIWRVDKPKSIEEILKALGGTGTQEENGLKTTLLEYPGSKEALEENQHVIARYKDNVKIDRNVKKWRAE